MLVQCKVELHITISYSCSPYYAFHGGNRMHARTRELGSSLQLGFSKNLFSKIVLNTFLVTEVSRCYIRDFKETKSARESDCVRLQESETDFVSPEEFEVYDTNLIFYFAICFIPYISIIRNICTYDDIKYVITESISSLFL